MTVFRVHALLALILLCPCGNKGETPTSSTTRAPISEFTALSGGYRQAIAPDGPQIVTLGVGAIWWEGDAPVKATLPPGTPVEGASWGSDGRSLYVGLGALDLRGRTWRPLPALETWNRRGPRGEQPVEQVSWFADQAHVALLRRLRTADGRRSSELVIVSAGDGSERSRRELHSARGLVALDQRLLIVAKQPMLLDLDGNVVAKTAPPLSVVRARAGAGRFAALGAQGEISLIQPADGTVVATWDIKAHDAIPVSGDVVTVDFDGNFRIGCLQGGALKLVAEAASGIANPVIQVVGDRLVVAGTGPDTVRVARFTNPCN